MTRPSQLHPSPAPFSAILYLQNHIQNSDNGIKPQNSDSIFLQSLSTTQNYLQIRVFSSSGNLVFPPINAFQWDFSSRKMPKSDSTSLGVPGDGRCLFRSVVHGAWIRAGKPSPGENLEKELADELRAKVADEFVKRRKDTEWFLEEDFDTYIGQIRQPHVWGGEPELLMSSHVLKVPITVYMRERSSGSLKVIAEYGQEYGKENPICVLYHGYGHYDALKSQISSTQPKLNKR